MNNNIEKGLTFNDVLVVPSYSEVLPSQTNTSTYFSRNLELNIPIISAAMDTVTESSMAIAMAQEGGIGVIHKNMSIKDQVNEVRKVKRSESLMIDNPITLEKNATVMDAKRVMLENEISGIPITNEKGLLEGIITNRDLRFEEESDKKLYNIMTKNVISINDKIKISEAEKVLKENKIEKLPVVSKDNKLLGLITFRDLKKIKTKPKSSKDKYGRLRVAATIGTSKDYLERFTSLAKASVDAIVIDTAHADSKNVYEVLKRIKKETSSIDVVVGNIICPDAAKRLIDLGADALKVGIGSGAICTTRIVTGVGYPQLSAIIKIHEIVRDKKIPIISDGGIRYTGDITKALVAGASSVMLGSLLAGTEESPGEMIIHEGKRFKSYRGMGSIEAMKAGSKDRYFQEKEENSKLVPEGIVGRVLYRGKLEEIIHQFLGGLKSGMGYCGAKTIKQLRDNKFVEITNSTIQEGHPHGITITKESPNYWK